MMRLCCLSPSYARHFRADTMEIFKFLYTCRALDLDGVSVHICNLNSMARRVFMASDHGWISCAED